MAWRLIFLSCVDELFVVLSRKDENPFEPYEDAAIQAKTEWEEDNGRGDSTPVGTDLHARMKTIDGDREEVPTVNPQAEIGNPTHRIRDIGDALWNLKVYGRRRRRGADWDGHDMPWENNAGTHNPWDPRWVKQTWKLKPELRGTFPGFVKAWKMQNFDHDKIEDKNNPEARATQVLYNVQNIYDRLDPKKFGKGGGIVQQDGPDLAISADDRMLTPEMAEHIRLLPEVSFQPLLDLYGEFTKSWQEIGEMNETAFKLEDSNKRGSGKE